MAPEFNFLMRINSKNIAEAQELASFVRRISGVELVALLRNSESISDQLAAGSSARLQIPMGETIRAWRLHNLPNLSLTEFSRACGLSKGYLSAVENCRVKRPSDHKLEIIASTLGISVTDLLVRRLPLAED
jgi:transcriptional regulator with XRE-family HTH domain